MKSRIELTDTTQSAIVKMAEGNPGALSALVDIVNTTPHVDPDNLFGGIGVIMSLDTLRIYGPRIWMLYKDVCKQNANRAIGLLRANQLGLLHDIDLHDAIDNNGVGIDQDELLKQVCEKLERFNLDWDPAQSVG